jgi:hypothetical protein
MTSNRQRYLSFAVAVAAGIFTLDRLVIRPYLGHRTGLVAERQDKQKRVTDARQVLQREKELRKTMAEMGDSLKAEPSDAEGQVLHSLQEWKQQSGLANASFMRSA